MLIEINLTLILLYFIMSTNNPVNASTTVLFLALSLFAAFNNNTGSSWFPIIFTILFTGGILIIFIILSAFQPNVNIENMDNNVVSSIIAINIIITYLSSNSGVPSFMIIQENKIFFQSSTTAIIITLLISTYFWVFVNIISKENNSIRTIVCYI